jgi:hypothetical protein
VERLAWPSRHLGLTDSKGPIWVVSDICSIGHLGMPFEPCQWTLLLLSMLECILLLPVKYEFKKSYWGS